MQRRSFLKKLLSISLISSVASNSLYAASSPYTGPIFVNIMAQGGMDVSCFCDPKDDTNINNWAKTKTHAKAGNIRYAPIGDNKIFFEKYYKDMLVINGIDLQTNGHAPAARHRFTGSLALGYPHISELIAEDRAKGYPMAYLFGGGYQFNLGYVPYNLIPSERVLLELSNANSLSSTKNFMKQEEVDMVKEARKARVSRLQNKGNLLPKQEVALRLMQESFKGGDLLAKVTSLLPNAIDTLDLQGNQNSAISKIHQSLISAQAGLSACIDISLGTFDTHVDHDNALEDIYPKFTNAIDYLWVKAKELGIDNRIIVHITSDVGRTSKYNDNGGKDHSRYSSSIFMKKNASWGNRVVGASDATHKSIKINPNTLEPDDNGVIIEPKHVIQAYRELAGVEGSHLSLRYSLKVQESINFFNDNNFQTGYIS